METVNDTVVGEGHKIFRWDRVVSIGLNSTLHLGLSILKLLKLFQWNIYDPVVAMLRNRLSVGSNSAIPNRASRKALLARLIIPYTSQIYTDTKYARLKI